MIGTARSVNQSDLTRTCPHCKATILASAVVCPGCKGHLRFDKKDTGTASNAAWQVEGTLEAGQRGAATEYSILVTVRDERNKEIARHVVNVGALTGTEQRTFTLSIETSEPSRRR